jgi:hypothetical protein
MSFKTSVNIRFDIGKDEFVNRYIPTPSHTEVLKGILDGFIKDSNRAHIVVGAYGTGKSLIATVLSSIVSKRTNEKSVEKLIGKFNHFDDYIADQINSASKLNKKYIPILLTGNEGRFRQAIVSNVIKALKADGIEIILPGISSKIVSSVEKWRTDFPTTYNAFVQSLLANGKDLNKWLEEVKNQNELELKFFLELYPQLTSGASFDADYNENLITQMEYINEILEEQNLGIIIVYDEFGRFLQGLNSTKLNEAMEDIQDLAELTNRSSSLQLLLITHKSLRQYFSGFSSDIGKEFQRIEKRFRQYHITSDQVTFLKIAEVILTENIINKPALAESLYNKTLQSLKKYALFPSLNPLEREQIIVKSMYPLHPVSLFILPHLSSVFGQNERTLFTFLESEETGGLLNHIRKSNSYYKPHQLFDYFFPDASETDVDQEVASNILLYKKAVARIPDNLVDKIEAINLIKFISIWNLCNLQQEQKLSSDFLAFVMQSDIKELESLIDILSNHKVLRYNRLSEHWELHAGSKVDINEKIGARKEDFVLGKDEVLKVLSKSLGKKYYFPERYNDEKDMTRFARVEIVLEHELSEIRLKFENNTVADLVLYYVIPEQDDVSAIKKRLLNDKSSDNELFVIHYKPISTIKQELYESYIIDELANDREFLSEDKGIKEELIFLQNESEYVIRKYLSALAEVDDNLIWINSNEEKRVSNAIALSELLSGICFRLFKETPRIINDSFNRMNVSGVQKGEAKKLIDGIINSPTHPQFGIEGSGPAYAIYASIFKNNANFDKNINELDYRNIDYKPYFLLREKLISLLDQKPKGNFNEIVKVFAGVPFGVRKPIVPILLVAMLRDRWSEFMLYRNEMFVPGLSGDKLFEILDEEGAHNYQYVYEQVDEEYIDFFNMIENHFESYIETRLVGQSNSRLIQICGTLVKWLRSLPRFTQISDGVSSELSNLRDIIRQTEVKPQQSIAELYELYNNDKFVDLLQIKEYGESYLEEFVHGIKKHTLSSLNVNNISEIINWATQQHEYVKKNNELVKTILSTDAEEEGWLSKFLELYTGVLIGDWSDKTLDKFNRDLMLDYNKAIDFHESEKSSDKKHEKNYVEVKFGNKKKVISKVEFSVKTKTVYSNIDRIINNAGRNMSKNELEYMIYLLMEQYVE